MRKLLSLFTLVLLISPAHAQDLAGSSTLRVFFDCQHRCDTRFITEALPIVDFVTEPTRADVHVLHAQQNTAGGGDRITLTFLGQRRYSALSDTLSYATSGDASSDEERRAMLHNLTIGLSRYLARAGLSDRLSISAIRPPNGAAASSSIEHDPWNYWAFSISANGDGRGQAATKSSHRRANFSANRTTEMLKVRLSGRLEDSRSEFDAGDEMIKSSSNSERFTADIVRSIGDQWAVGGGGSISASSFQNAKLQMEIGPAVEYDFFPYSESTRRLLTLEYSVLLGQRRYDELTIFALDKETILRQSLKLSLSLAQKWGSVSLSTDANHLLTNFDRSLTDSYRLGFFARGNVRLFRGLSFDAFATYDRIRDQIDLPADGATKEEILLQSIQLPTGYSYRVRFGLTYRFGSIYNNVVNPRMGGGGGDMIIIM